MSFSMHAYLMDYYYISDSFTNKANGIFDAIPTLILIFK